MKVLDKLLYMLPAVSAALLIVSLISRQASRTADRQSRRDTTKASTESSAGRSHVVSGLTRWLAIRLMFAWGIVLIARLVSTAL